MINFYRKLFQRSFRLSMIALLTGLIFGFGHFMTPREPDAFAKWVYDAADSLSSPGVPEYMKFRVDEEKVQEVYLNGNTLFYTLNRTNKKIPALLDHYEHLYSTKVDRVIAEPAAIDALVNTVPDKKSRDEHRRQIAMTEKILNDRFIRFEGEGWGGFSTIVTGKEADPDYTGDIHQRFAEMKKTGLASSLGDPKIVVAFDDPSDGSTQYFNVWPDDDFDHRKVRPRGEEDAPGFDIDDIQRPFGARRLLTFSQNHGGVRYSILVYRGQGTTSGVLDEFATEMSTDGWSLSSTFEQARMANGMEEPSLLLAKGNREAYISLRASVSDGTVTSTVIVYDQG